MIVGVERRPTLLQVVWSESSVFGYPRQNLWAYFFLVVEGKPIVRPSFSLKSLMGTWNRPLNAPTYPEESGQDLPRLTRWPLTHTAVKTSSDGNCWLSPYSTRSASTRRARASTRKRAS
jgi:hypothetical protein